MAVVTVFLKRWEMAVVTVSRGATMRRMRKILVGVLAAGLAFVATPEAQQAAITGRIVTGTGQDAKPVRRARVVLTGGALKEPLVTDSDANGTYRFTVAAAGPYRVAIQKPGFVPHTSEAPPGSSIVMTRGAAIEGVVADAGGDPVWNVLVSAHQVQPDGTKKAVATTRTDDLGRYRLHSLAAADYYVEAATDLRFLVNLFLLQGEKRPDVTSAFYPSAETIDVAKPVRVTAGGDVTSIDVTFAPPLPARDPAAPPPPPRPDATGTGRIAGVVTDGTSGKPIAGARMLLVPVEGQRLTNWTRTNAKGQFEYTSLQARRYTLRFEADRFVTLEFGQTRPGETGTQIQLADGEQFRADMKLPRASALEGALLDEFGEPAPGVLVQLAQRQYAAGRTRLMPVAGRIVTSPTDDRGHYRVSNLPPGDYHVAALSGAYTDADASGGFAPTYYPGTTDAGAATPIAVAFGADTTGITFALAPARTLSVSGTMVDAEGRPVSGRGTFWLATPDRLQRMDFNLARGVTAPDGTFRLRHVPQGSYTLQGFAPPPPGYQGPGNLGAMSFGWLSITVGETDLEGVVLKTTAGRSLRGKFVMDDSAAAPLTPNQVGITAIPIEFDSAPIGGGPPPAQVRPDMTFEVARLSGQRRVFVSLSAPDLALKKITLNDMDVTDAPLDFREKDVDGIEVILTNRVSRVTGAVSDDRGPVSDYVVIVFPSDPTKWTDRSRFISIGRPTQLGRFAISGLPPEEYLAIALPNVIGAEFFNPEFLQQLRVQATPVSLGEGETKTIELKLKRRP